MVDLYLDRHAIAERRDAERFPRAEPLLSHLASLVVTGDPGSLALDLKKGSVTCLRVDGNRAPGSGVLRWSASPKLLRRLGSVAR